MAVDLSIRRARLVDVPHLVELYKQLDIMPEPEMPLDLASARFRALTEDPRHRIYVSEHEGQIVGTFSVTFIGGISHSARDSCIVEDVVVAPGMQGTGIGKRMMRFAMDLCAARDCYKLVLSSHLRRSAAHRFYESLGFDKHGYSFLISPADGLPA